MRIDTITTLFLLQALLPTKADHHFYGGSLSFLPVQGKPNTGRFIFKATWNSSHLNAPGCSAATLGKPNPRKMDHFESWLCDPGCSTPLETVAPLDYTCATVDEVTELEQGDGVFEVTFTGEAWPAVVFYESLPWRKLSHGMENFPDPEFVGWSIAASLDLRNRSDIHRPNGSPITLPKMMHEVQFGCESKLKIPVVEPDGDVFRCRFGNSTVECSNTCYALPPATLDADSCVLEVHPTTQNNYTIDGWYVISVVIEDFPRRDILLEGNVSTIDEPLSFISSQILLHVVPKSVACDRKPLFISPTPAQDHRFDTPVLSEFKLRVSARSADAGSQISQIIVQGPYNINRSSGLTSDAGFNTFTKEITWIPIANQMGEHVLCITARDSRGMESDYRCVTVSVGDADDCAPSPCRNGAPCLDLFRKYKCVCPDGYEGQVCDREIPVTCLLAPCLHGGNCTDNTTANTVMCSCPETYTGQFCQILVQDDASDSNGLIVWLIPVLVICAIASIVPGVIIYLKVCRKPRSKVGTLTNVVPASGLNASKVTTSLTADTKNEQEFMSPTDRP